MFPSSSILGYADDKGGGEVLAFATRPTAPPSKETLGLLSGVIAGGPLIRQTTPASAIEVTLFYLHFHPDELTGSSKPDPY
jgi:hypothetical protein